MRNAYGCARLLNSDQSLLARPDRAGNFLANKRFFQKYRAAPPVSLSHPRRVPAEWQLVWTDGSALNNGHPSCAAGSAWASLCGRSQLCRLAGPLLSNNIAELCAVLLALRAWPDCALHIHTDSSYVLGLVCGGLLAMERDGWLDAPIFSVACADSGSALGFSVPALGVHMRYSAFSLGSLGFTIPALGVHMCYDALSLGCLGPLFQALLFELRSHSGRLWFSKVKAHANDYMNNLVDLLTKQALQPGSPVLDVAAISAPPGWVDRGPVLNCQLLAFLTDVVVSSSPPPSLAPSSLHSSPRGRPGWPCISLLTWTPSLMSRSSGVLTSQSASASCSISMSPPASPSVTPGTACWRSVRLAAAAPPCLWTTCGTPARPMTYPLSC